MLGGSERQGEWGKAALQERRRWGKSSSPREKKVKLPKAALGCCNRRVQGTFLWLPSRVRSAVDPTMAMLTLSAEEVFLMPRVL